MELMDAIFSRRAVRRYTDQEVPDHILDRLLEAAVQAPSAMNRQPWAFTIVRGRDQLADFSSRAKAYVLATTPTTFVLHSRTDEFASPEVNLFHGAGTLVLILAKPGGLDARQECCLAAANLMLAAHDVGLATCPIGAAQPWLNLLHVKTELGIPGNYTVVLPLTLGYPAETPPAPPRLPPEIVYWHNPEIREVNYENCSRSDRLLAGHASSR